jgi:acyl-CoA synthetase (AMP-forming)/AMP-acid ligase II
MSSVYGQTETCGIITYTDGAASLADMADTVGKPLAGAELRIAGPEGQILPPGDVGEIQIRGPYIMSGYYRMPEATQEAFTPDGFLRTGDLGFVRADGNLVFTGRLKEMFKSGGYNVFPLEVEQIICTHPAVEMAVVVPVPHEKFQEVGHADIKLRDGAALQAEDLKQFLRERIANYKIPKSFRFLNDLPLLANGKIDRRALKDRASASHAAE